MIMVAGSSSEDSIWAALPSLHPLCEEDCV